MPQKPPDLDQYGNPISTGSTEKPPDLDVNGAPIQAQPSILSRGWKAISEPLTTFPSELGRSLSDWITEPSLATSPTGEGGIRDFLAENYARAKGFVGGSLEGLGNVASELTSPVNLALAGLTGGESIAGRAGLPQIARLAKTGARLVSAPFAIHGASQALSPESTLSERGMGLAEIAGGVAGMVGGKPLRPGAKPILEAPIESGVPSRAVVNPEIAATIKAPAESIIPGNILSPIESATVNPEGIQAAFKAGKINQSQAVQLLEKFYTEEVAKAKPKISPKVTEEVAPVVEKAVSTEEVTIPPVKALDQLPTPPGLTDVIKAIPETGNEELDSMVRSLRAMRRRKGIDQFNELETQAYNGLMENIKNHPALPEDLRNRWGGIETKLESTSVASVDEAVKLIASRQVMNVSELRSKFGVDFSTARNIWYKAKKQIEETSMPEGFFKHMRKAPEEAPKTPKGLTYIIKKENATPEFIQKARDKGYEFQGLNDKGDFRFKKVGPEPARSMRPDVTINLMRGANDPVRVVFADPTDKLVFQALATKEGVFKNPGVLEQLQQKFPDTPPQDVVKAAQQFRNDVIAQAKALPKQAESGLVGDLKVEPTKSFRDYLSHFITSEKGELIIGGTKKSTKDIPVGRVILIKSGKANPETVKKLFDAGFRFLGENDAGDLRFKKTELAGKAPVLESEVGLKRPTKRAIQGELGAIQDAQKSSVIMEAFNFPRGVMASWDFSAPLRQGLPLIHKKAFWTSLKPMFESWASEEGFKASQEGIANRALFKKRVDQLGNKLPSFADDAGLKLTDLTDLSKREEAIMSTWAERVPIVRRSNRAYTSFLNNLRADTFESLIKDAGILVGDPKKNLPLARAIADFVNTASGRGSLGKLEQSATILNTGLFAPRLIAARVKMLNPAYYIMAPPIVRKEAIKSLLAVATAGNTILQLAKMGGAEVSSDPNSSDFGKAKIGNTRIDPWGGFQQYVVAANRLLRPSFAAIPGFEGGSETGIAPIDLTTGFLGGGGQKVTSSTSGNEYDLWNPRGPYDPTHLTIGSRLLRGKTNPVLGFAWGILAGQKEMSGQPMNFTTLNPMENSIMQRFIPILMQDIYQLAKEDPELLPFVTVPATFGMGVQTYGGEK